MGFYDEISRYYDYIFPVGASQLEFIKNSSGEPPKSLLDIACGTGGYSIELAKQGYNMTAVDIDGKMVDEAKKKAEASETRIDVFQADMLNLNMDNNKLFDTVFCIGNSIVHLGNLDEIGKFILNIKALIKKGGNAVFQIINYDRIIEKGIAALPTIKNESIGLSFERIYELDKTSKMILFKTILKVDGQVIDNVISLFPLLSDDFISISKSAGFNNIDVFGDFKKSPYIKDSSYMTVLRIS